MKMILLFTCALVVSACGQQKPAVSSPAGYDFNNPVVYKMPAELREISGLAFYQGDPSMIFAEQDEQGNLYQLRPQETTAKAINFGADGDYEDLALAGGQAILLRSDGTLYSFPFQPSRIEATAGKAEDVKEWKDLLPKGEYEGLYADASADNLFVLCKDCAVDRHQSQVTIYKLNTVKDSASAGTDHAGGWALSGTFQINTEEIASLLSSDDGVETPEVSDKQNKKNKKGKAGKKAKALNFKPSALSWNNRDQRWFVLSSVNKLLVLADANWQVQEVYPLDPALFPQPEGIAFDSTGDLYISNEGPAGEKGTILKFPYLHP
ncbi:MAG TPA: SdiA-regulated domain-containing protein [Arachidicoccus sp.]|nr:SdiA-regulated domain-containing protein [Arachidicoccus sp.]